MNFSKEVRFSGAFYLQLSQIGVFIIIFLKIIVEASFFDNVNGTDFFHFESGITPHRINGDINSIDSLVCLHQNMFVIK